MPFVRKKLRNQTEQNPTDFEIGPNVKNIP